MYLETNFAVSPQADPVSSLVHQTLNLCERKTMPLSKVFNYSLSRDGIAPMGFTSEWSSLLTD